MISRGRASWLVLSLLSASPLLAQSPPAAGEQAVPSVASLFRDVGQDIRRLPSLETGLLLGGAGAVALGIRGHDRIITHRATSSNALDLLFESGEVMGGGRAQVSAAIVTYAVGRLTGHAKVATVGADLVRGQILSTLLTQGIKLSARRVRPDGGRFSFPSGHASSTFASAAVLGRHFGWKVGVPAYAVAAYVAGSRLQENKHFLSDVVFGAAVGIVAGRTVTVGRGAARFSVSPLASPLTNTGAGIAFTWVGAR